MSVTSNLAEAFEATRTSLPGDAGARADAFARFERNGLPVRKMEAWRWTDLTPIEAAVQARANDIAPDHRQWLIEGVEGPVLVFVDGRYVAEASRPEQVELYAGDAPAGDAHPLGDLAQAMATGGIVLKLGPDHATRGPIQLIHIATGGPAHLRNHIDLDEDAQASLIETYVDAAGAAHAWTNVVTDIRLAQSARLMRTVRQMKAGGLHTELTRAEIGQGGSYRATTLVSGADSSRSESHVRLAGIGAFASVDGVLLGRRRQIHDVANRITHAAPEGMSRQTWRSVADEQATVSFAGKVEVVRDAQLTDAEQSVKALLLQRTATANAKPELEIFADDVKCAHGATVGELDRQALFYLESRGVEPEQARALLTEAFIADALATIGEDELRETVTDDAMRWLRGGTE